MTKPKLTVDRLRDAGFKEVGCWELRNAGDLNHSIDLPSGAGVYAFAINGLVYYAGLASQSLRKRIGFYKRPAKSQSTNIRLSEIIRGEIERGATVQILIANPPDHEWHGLMIKGAEGLEAGLIASYDLAWNVRGKHGNATAQVLEHITKRPGMTELEIAKAVYGRTAVQQQVNQHCRALVGTGQVRRVGTGGRADPYTYHPVSRA